MELDVLTGPEWLKWSELAHLICFNASYPKERERVDFALVARIGNTLQGYASFFEFDGESVYMRHVGAFPPAKGSMRAWIAGKAFMEYLAPRYKRVHCYIENTNKTMLGLARHAGFLIVGTRNLGERVLVEHVKELVDV